MLNFCTLFDSNYLTRGLAMYYSLIKHCPDSNLFIVCLDDKLYDYLNRAQLNKITIIQLCEVEAHFPDLAIAKQNRTYVEYIFTLSPAIALYRSEERRVG